MFIFQALAGKSEVAKTYGTLNIFGKELRFSNKADFDKAFEFFNNKELTDSAGNKIATIELMKQGESNSYYSQRNAPPGYGWQGNHFTYRTEVVDKSRVEDYVGGFFIGKKKTYGDYILWPTDASENKTEIAVQPPKSDRITTTAPAKTGNVITKGTVPKKNTQGQQNTGTAPVATTPKVTDAQINELAEMSKTYKVSESFITYPSGNNFTSDLCSNGPVFMDPKNGVYYDTDRTPSTFLFYIKMPKKLYAGLVISGTANGHEYKFKLTQKDVSFFETYSRSFSDQDKPDDNYVIRDMDEKGKYLEVWLYSAYKDGPQYVLNDFLDSVLAGDPRDEKGKKERMRSFFNEHPEVSAKDIKNYMEKAVIYFHRYTPPDYANAHDYKVLLRKISPGYFRGGSPAKLARNTEIEQ